MVVAGLDDIARCHRRDDQGRREQQDSDEEEAERLDQRRRKAVRRGEQAWLIEHRQIAADRQVRAYRVGPHQGAVCSSSVLEPRAQLGS